jgi:hypothetical protein
MLDAGVVETKAEVCCPLACRDDTSHATGRSEALEGDVPEPGRVAPVCFARVDDQQQCRRRTEQRQGLRPARRVLGQKQPQAVPSVLDHGVTRPDGLDLSERCRGIGRFDPEHRRRRECDGRVAHVESARQAQLDRHRRTVGGNGSGVVRAPPRPRAAEVASATPPLRAGVENLTTARAGATVTLPAGSGRNPHRVPRRGGGPDDHRIVGVGQHRGVRVPDQGRGQGRGDRAHLRPAIELVSAQVEQHDDLRLDCFSHRRDVQLVDLEDRVRGPPVGRERGDGAVGHVGARRIVGYPLCCA